MERLIVKKTGTYADALEAIGTADLMGEIGFRNVTIRDCGGHFSVESLTDIHSDQWPQLTSGYPYIWEPTKEPARPLLECLDYEAEKQKNEVWKKFQQSSRKTRKRIDAAAGEQDIAPPAAPVRDYRTASMLASMRKGWNADRDLAKWLFDHPAEASAWVRSALCGETESGDAPRMTNSQVLNPIAGKGIHAAKTELRSANSLTAQLIEPFAEWMKLRGLWRGMLLHRVGDDYKFFVLEPADIPADQIALVKNELDQLNLWGDVKLDIEASLRCAEILLRYSDTLKPESGIRMRRRSPRMVVAGLRQAYFKSLGTAAALMNDALLPLPDWFAVNDRNDADDYFAIIAEAIGKYEGGQRTYGCLVSLDESKSGEGRILQQYRQWLLTGGLFELLEFHAQFSVHLMQTDRPRAFTTPILDKLFIRSFQERYPAVKEIIENSGFQSVARAVRNTTVYAVGMKNSNREIRFGLAQKWKQKLKAGKGDFMAEVADFIQSQNWEVVNRLEGRGHVVTTPDLDSLVDLVDRHGAELVGLLLLAYGYARAPKVDADPEIAN